MNKELTQKPTYAKHIKYKRSVYTSYSKQKETSTKKFIENIVIYNKATQQHQNLKYDFMQRAKDDYLWFVYNQKMLELRLQEQGTFTAIFLTLTLPSSFHKYSTKRKAYNHQYNEENTIDKGYQLLNNTFRSIYNKFKVNNKFVKTYYSKVVEAHKDFTPHLHAIVYVPSEFVNEFETHIKNNIKNNELGEQYDIEVINDIEKSSAYLLKYIAKSTNPQDEKSFHLFNGWKKLHKIRVFTQSQCELPRYIFKKVNGVLRLSKGLENKNPIIEILQKCSITVTTQNTLTKEVKYKSYGTSSNALFEVNIEREVTKKLKYEMIETLEHIGRTSRVKGSSIRNPHPRHIFVPTEIYISNGVECEALDIYFKNMEVDESVFKYKYKINNFVITDVRKNEILYSKANYVLASNYFEDEAIRKSLYAQEWREQSYMQCLPYSTPIEFLKHILKESWKKQNKIR